MENNKNTTIKKILSRIKIYKFQIALSLLFATINVGFTLYINILVGLAIDDMIGQGHVNFEAIFETLTLIGICALVVGISQWIMSMINNSVTYSVVKNLRDDVFEHIQKLPLKYLDKNSSGSIVSKIITDIDQFSEGLLLGFTKLLTGIMTIVGTLIFMLYVNWHIALVVVCITPLSFVVANFIAKRSHSLFKSQSEIRGEQTAIIDEAIGELKVVKAFSQEDEILEDFDEVNERLRQTSAKAIFISSLTNPATRFVNSMVYAGVCVSGALVAISGGFTVGSLTIFLSYANQYTKPFNEISGVIAEVQNALACAKRVFDLLEEPEIVESYIKDNNLNNVKGEIEIKNLDFSYSADTELIKNFNLKVKAGDKVAIVGPTGCGKTTIINLLMRFYNAHNGDILIDGVNIKDISYNKLRSCFGMVLQDTWLKAGTIKENILLSKPTATDEEVINAAKFAHAHSFIRRLPNGYDTQIGQSGDSLSQGQKQLLCIARAVLAIPSMLILDEATSSIDTMTEMRIQRAFEKMMVGRTTFIVAHRLSTTKKADVILVMKDGKIIEHGSHEELLQLNGFYTNLYQSQFAN